MEPFGKALIDVSIDDINTIVHNKIPESRIIDYKLELYPETDAGNKEFLKDISAFANTVGGYLIFGIHEKNGAPVEIKGIEFTDFDKIQLRFENLLRTGVDPPIRGVESKPFDFKDSKKIIVTHVPKSISRPHVVKIKKHYRFYGRNSSGVHMLEVDELRRAFLASETLATQIRTFRNDRLAQIATGEGNPRLMAGPKIVLHLIPESAFELGKKYDLKQDLISNIKLVGTQYPRPGRYNYEGFISCINDRQSGEVSTYTQIFHNGIIEAVDMDLFKHADSPLHWSYFKQEIISACDSLIQTQRKIGVDFPIWAGLSLLEIRGYKFDLMGKDNFSIECSPIEKDELIIPETYIEHSGISGKEIFKTSFDLILNACGQEAGSVCED